MSNDNTIIYIITLSLFALSFQSDVSLLLPVLNCHVLVFHDVMHLLHFTPRMVALSWCVKSNKEHASWLIMDKPDPTR